MSSDDGALEAPEPETEESDTPGRGRAGAKRRRPFSRARGRSGHGPRDGRDEARSDTEGPATENPADTPEGAAGKQKALHPHRLRWGLLAIAIGAVVAALVTLSISGFRSSHGLEARNPGAKPAGRADVAFGSAKSGDCLTWTDSKTLDLNKVNCSDKHLFEVTADIDLSRYPGREFGPGSAFPDSLRFGELRDEHCVSAAEAYLGGRLDPRGKFVVGMVNPGEPGWRNGDRTIRCGLQLVSATGNATQQAVGRVSDNDQSRVFDTGTCIGINQNLPTNEPVPCGAPHAYEVMSTVDLGAHFNGGPPSNADQDKFMQDECAGAAQEYMGGQDALINKTLTIFWDNLDARSWLAGSRKLNCLVGKGSQDGFATVTGSAKGDILIDGQAPVAPPSSGRSTPAPLPGAAPAPIPPDAPR
ncbi:septum formation family protein [Nocardia vermiculata]|uniref:Septum formation family protein n=1 Tax=Nocardia vermiculata TaxID=257274 RepID=A0A846Y067_9NOCA|nr:septum formation family protein [Nocardia vermiculata]NKY49939.1 septum formation family protein [Nocardia vermiculata]